MKQYLRQSGIDFIDDGLLRSSYLNRKLKVLVYRVVIRPIVLYGSETWTLRKSDEELLRAWERKILRRVFGAVCDNGE